MTYWTVGRFKPSKKISVHQTLDSSSAMMLAKKNQRSLSNHHFKTRVHQKHKTQKKTSTKTCCWSSDCFPNSAFFHGNRGGGVKNHDARDPTFDPNFKTQRQNDRRMFTSGRKLNNMFFFKWAWSKRSCNCLCRMIALRACLRIPYAITFLAYAGDLFDMALREAYAGTFFTFFICPHRKCLREPFFHLRETIHVNCVKNNSVCFCSKHIIFRHLLLPTFRKLYARFHEHPVSYNSLSRARIFSKHMCLSIAHLHQSVLTPKACLGGIVGNWWEIVGCAYAGLTLTLRGPYADFGNFFI